MKEDSMKVISVSAKTGKGMDGSRSVLAKLPEAHLADHGRI
jgi:hypothetical protein